MLTGLDGSMDGNGWSVSLPVGSRWKYVNNYWMDWDEIYDLLRINHFMRFIFVSAVEWIVMKFGSDLYDTFRMSYKTSGDFSSSVIIGFEIFICQPCCCGRMLRRN